MMQLELLVKCRWFFLHVTISFCTIYMMQLGLLVKLSSFSPLHSCLPSYFLVSLILFSIYMFSMYIKKTYMTILHYTMTTWLFIILAFDIDVNRILHLYALLMMLLLFIIFRNSKNIQRQSITRINHLWRIRTWSTSCPKVLANSFVNRWCFAFGNYIILGICFLV